MNPAAPELSRQPVLDIPGLLLKAGLRPNKRLGQNFLIDSASLEKVIQAAELDKDDVVLEIGAGLGSLTRYLAVHSCRVTAVELDERLFRLLAEIMAAYPNVRLVQGDILKLDPAALAAGYREENLERNYVVAANIPYYITSAVIRHVLEASRQPDRIVLTIQREVAERICAEPGEMSLLSLSVQVYGQPKITARIPAGAFYPVPQVDSSVVQVKLFNEPLIPRHQLKLFFQLVKAGFSQKRKTLRNALAGGLHLSPQQAGDLLRIAAIDPQRRAETLSLDEWRALVAASLSLLRPDHQ